MEKFENINLSEVKSAETMNVNGKQVIKVTYYDDTYVNIPYTEEDLGLLQQQVNNNKVTKSINLRIAERNKKAMDDKKEVVAIPGTEKTYKETTGLNNEEYGRAVVDKTTAQPKAEKKSNGWGYVLVAGLGLGVLAAGLKGCADKMKTADDYKPATNTIETSAEENIADDLGGIKTYNAIDFYTAVNDINTITASMKEQGYLDKDKDVVLTEDGINSLYFMSNVSEMDEDARNRFITNRIVRDSSNAIIEDTRNALEVSNIIDNHYARGMAENYMDLSAFFANDKEASEVYNNYVNALTALRNMKPEDKDAINRMYQDAYSWAIDNNSATFGNPKSINNTGALYVMNNLIRKNIVATMLEQGYINEAQYYAIMGDTNQPTEIRETNDVMNLLQEVCGEKEAVKEITK